LRSRELSGAQLNWSESELSMPIEYREKCHDIARCCRCPACAMSVAAKQKTDQPNDTLHQLSAEKQQLSEVLKTPSVAVVNSRMEIRRCGIALKK